MSVRRYPASSRHSRCGRRLKMCRRHIFETPRHIGAATVEAQKRIGVEIVDIIEAM